MEGTTTPPPQEQQAPELTGEKRKREEGSPAAPAGENPAMEDTTQPPQQQEEAQPAGEKRKREEDEAPEASAGDAAPASAPAGEEATAAAPTGEGARHPMSKTSLCSFFRRRGGGPDGCNHGEACRYAHTEEELRPRPDGTWDPTSDRAKKLRRVSEEDGEAVEDEKRGRWGQEEVTIDDSSLDKCLVGLSRHWLTDRLKSFLDEQGISYAVAKKKKGMTVGFVTFETVEQLKNAVEVLKENRSGGKQIKIADANRRSHQKLHSEGPVSNNGAATENSSDAAAPDEGTPGPEAGGGTKRTVRDAVTPLAHMTYSDQLEHKKSSVAQLLKKLTRNAKKACPADVTLPDWISNAKQIGGLSCKLEGILESPVIDGYRNKCEFSVGHSLAGKKTVGFMLGNFREGVTAVEEPVDCPNVSALSCKYAMMFQDFLQLSCLPAWNRVDNSGFWRQFTVREGRSPAQAVVAQDTQTQISEVMIIIQVCSTGVDEAQMKDEFAKLTKTLVQGAATCLPPLPLTTIVVQDHTGISNVAPADCPLIPLLVPEVDQSEEGAVDKTRIHDHISNLRFSLSPTAFFQVNTLAAERLYTLAGDWANLNSDTLLFDVCCGTGTIGLTLAHRVGMVVGIEMNESAVVDAQRNALINGIKNCRFVCGKAEDVMGSLLTEYLGSPQQHIAASESNSEVNAAGKKEDIVDGAENNGKSMDSLTEENDNGESQQLGDKSANHPTCSSKELEGGHEQCNEAVRNQNSEEASSLVNDESVDAKAADGSEHIKTSNNDVLAAIGCQFKNFVAIVDPPRAGLHPTVIKVLRTHPRIRRLVYISCNPDTLVANAIELCTPSTEHREKNKGHRGWRNMSSAGLARQRTKSMPNSEPFVPKRAMAVDLFPHTSHCEMVMLFER
ncbi:zinc finger CCCH domain-containing protein 24 [Hordeum vulgare subsp. vulgare]|nr:zinc finger CCCH domain-containing protein 24 [Hordeum vulgare subsp. vulgare]